jgi:membrane protein DedA with SNARE-associated domain
MLDNLSSVLSAGPSLKSALGFFLASFTTEIVAPIPSPFLLIGGGFFLTNPFSTALLYKAMIYLVIPLTLGSTSGATVIYLIAYYGGKPALERSRKYLRFSWEDVEKFEKKLSKRKFDVLILFISRMIPLVPTTVGNILAGLIRMNPVAYFLVTIIGIFIRITLLLFAFKIFGKAIFLTGFNL